MKEAERLDVIQIVGFMVSWQQTGHSRRKDLCRSNSVSKANGPRIVEKLIAYQAGESYEKTTLIPTALYKKEDAEQDPELRAAE